MVCIIILSFSFAYPCTVANVPDAESQFHAHEFLDATVQPKPIYISPNEIYSMHGLLEQYINDVVSAKTLSLTPIV